MRGKGFKIRLNRIPNGITPAYAGKRAALNLCLKNYEDHPRLCGEKLNTAIDTFNLEGSPPPMRGKEFMRFITVTCDRITPAYAGKSIFLPQNGHGLRDHPRLCGEKLEVRATEIDVQGSPPPMRGKVCTRCRACRGSGITPAYAGKRRCGQHSGLF